MGQNEPKLGPKLVFFCHFLKLGSLLFLEIVSLQQYLTFGRRKIYEISFSQRD